jgi:tight adherence protein B
MLIPLLFVFLVGVGLVVGGYFAVSALPGKMAARRLDQRLRDVSSFGRPEAPADDPSILKQADQGPLPAIDRAMEKTRVGSGLGKLIEQSGTRTTPSGIVVMALALAVLSALVASMFAPLHYSWVPAAITGGAMPFIFLKHRRKMRLKKFEEQFPEALDLLSRAIRAGHAFQTAMGMIADEMAAPVGPEFKKTFDQQNFGLPLRDALNQLSERVPILDVRFFVTAVMIQRDTGGNLSEILDNLAHVVRERFKILRQVRVHTAHGRFTGWVLLALPAALAVVLSYISPQHMETLFKERIGQEMLVAAMIMQTIGFFWIRKVIKIEV